MKQGRVQLRYGECVKSESGYHFVTRSAVEGSSTPFLLCFLPFSSEENLPTRVGKPLRTLDDLPTRVGKLLRPLDDLPTRVGKLLRPLNDLPTRVGNTLRLLNDLATRVGKLLRPLDRARNDEMIS